MVQSWKKTAIGLTGAVLAIFGAAIYLKDSQLLMPSEYKTIKKIVNRLADNNDLGNRQILFTIVPGAYVNWLAEELNICKEDECTFYGNLNPFQKFKGNHSSEINDAFRQAYLFGGIQAAARPNGTIRIYRSTFRVYENKNDFLACTIAHEISHFLNNDQFNDSLEESKKAKGLDEKKREIISKRIRRQSEVNANNEAARMLYKANYPINTCLNDLKFLARVEGDGEETKDDSTHPGYEESIAAMDYFIGKLKKEPLEQETKKIDRKWKYNRDLNALTFTPF